MPSAVARREIAYPKHKVGLATLPLYFAAFPLILALTTRVWLVVLLWAAYWICTDRVVSRFFIWQVNSQRRPVWKSLAAIVAIGLTADVIVVAAIYSFYALSRQ